MQSNLYVRLENVSVSFGMRSLFQIDSLCIYEGDRIGLVGMNGTGKTTLLRLLAGDIPPDRGKIIRCCQPLYFQQFTVDIPSREAIAPAELSRFGVRELKEQDTVSGGESTRLRLAQVFSSDRAFLLLDEPSSNLDRAGIEYLNQRLRAVRTFVLVSHDRDMLNSQCSRILEIEDGQVRSYEGNYDAFRAQKEAARRRAQTEYEQYIEEVRRLQSVYQAKKEKARRLDRKPKKMSASDAKVREFSASHRSVASKAQTLERSAANIQQRIAHMEVRQRPRESPRIRPDFRLTDPPQSKIIIEAERFSFAYPNGREIFRGAAFRLPRGSHAAVLGPNGAGKTTLLRLIQAGEPFRIAPKARLGFFHQSLSDLRDNRTVIESVMEMSVQKEEVARAMLARLLFRAQDIDKPVGILSGGERARLCFARLFVSAANVLVLDEPTNYLDIPSVEALQTLFAEYEGTLLFVSHDAAFVRAVATERLLIENKKIRVLDGPAI